MTGGYHIKPIKSIGNWNKFGREIGRGTHKQPEAGRLRLFMGLIALIDVAPWAGVDDKHDQLPMVKGVDDAIISYPEPV